MPTIPLAEANVTEDERLFDRVMQATQQRGLDDHDEVWDGTYVVMPLANNEHQAVSSQLVMAYGPATDFRAGERCLAGANVTDRPTDWVKNFRVPDFLIYLAGNPAENRDTHWLGGPDLAVEVVSPNDRSREKLEFYAAVGTRELVVLDRDPWAVEVYRLVDGRMKSVATAAAAGESVETTTVPAVWHLVSPTESPYVEVEVNGARTPLA